MDNENKDRKVRANKSTKVERLDRIRTLIGQGVPRYKMVAMLSEEWNVVEQQIYRYLNMVYKELEQQWTNKNFHTDLYNQYVHLYELAVKKGDRREAKSVLDSINKFFKGEKLDVTSGGEPISININFKNTDGD